MARREPDTGGWLRPAQPARRVAATAAQHPDRAPPVILALNLLDFLVVPRRSAWQAFMFTLNLDLCGTQIT
jgi:hypothetical protein